MCFPPLLTQLSSRGSSVVKKIQIKVVRIHGTSEGGSDGVNGETYLSGSAVKRSKSSAFNTLLAILVSSCFLLISILVLLILYKRDVLCAAATNAANPKSKRTKRGV